MNVCKRTVMAIAMLVVISMPLSLFLYYKVQQWVVRYEMKEKLELSQLQTIELSASSVQWNSGEKEIVIEGRLFDVKSYTTDPATFNIQFTGLFDVEETEIEDKIKKMLRQKDGSKRSLVQSALLFFCPFPGSPALTHLYASAETSFDFYTSQQIPLTDISIPDPPPKG